MRSPEIWLAGISIAVPVLMWGGSGCGGGSSTSSASGSGGSGGATSVTSSTVTGSSVTSTTSSTATTSTGSGGTGGTSSSSSSSVTSSSSGTGGMPPVNDTCPGTAIALNPGDTMTVSGTTVAANDDYSSFCGDMTTTADNPDVAYAITLMNEGTFTVTVTADTGSALVPAIDVRSDCAMSSDYCVGTGTASEVFSADLLPGTYYVIVDGTTGATGSFSLTASLTAANCGDGLVNPGEDCDPGAGVANDGCGDPGTTGECKFQPAPASEDACPGQAIALLPGTAGTTVVSAAQGTSTYGFSDDYMGSCATYMGGLDRVFQIIPAASGTMKVSLGYEADGITATCAADIFAPECWAHVLYARTTCGSTASEIACLEDGNDPSAPSTITFAVTAATPYYVFVDGYDDQNYSYGPFNLIVSLQ